MPHSVHVAQDSRITAFDRSRPQPILPPWREVTKEQFEAAQAMAYPVWTEAGPSNVPPAPPLFTTLQSEALRQYRSEAAQCLDMYVPSPWDRLKELATQAYREWVDSLMALIAAELARLEAAVLAAQTPEALSTIVAEFPEVEE